MDKREEQIKLELAKKYFPQFDCSHILGNIDFSVAVTAEKGELFHGSQYLLWAEAKKGTKANIYDSLVQLIMTIGKERTFEKVAPPLFIGAFDEEKIAFIQYHKIQEVFFQNDFNWNVAPSDHTTKEFLQLKKLVSQEVKENDADAYLFYYSAADRALEKFISKNFKVGKETITLLPITKNNFTFIFYKWCEQVKPTIQVDWNFARTKGVFEGHFFLADILSQDNKSIFDKLHVILRENKYFVDQNIEGSNIFNSTNIGFSDDMKAHRIFWTKYKRPPREEFWDYFIERVDLLVPQDIRERKGSYFTPQIWVEKSQQYLADVLGDDWQDEYYIWDCCAGTGNMESGLTNKYRVWASTLDMADVKIMHERIKNGANLLPAHCFQFDFLNDDLQDAKVPEDLRKILSDEEKRKKLIIYINPPYAEAGDGKQSIGTGKNKAGVATKTQMYARYKNTIGKAAQELFAQFFIRIYNEISGAWLAEFSTLKILQAPNFREFRNVFLAKLEKFFLVPAKTFDNVKGQFPIGFFVWNTQTYSPLINVKGDVYNSDGKLLFKKSVYCNQQSDKTIGQWLACYKGSTDHCYGMMNSGRTDFQNQKYCYIINYLSVEKSHAQIHNFNEQNLLVGCIYLSVRHCIDATWINDRDQFLYPYTGWDNDIEFQTDCLAFTLFHGQNKISSKYGTNHWIPFTEEEVGAKMAFDSHFMSDFIRGKHKVTEQKDLFGQVPAKPEPIVFSPEAQAVMDAGRELWRYYHSIIGANPNASFYDIRAHFQGQDDKGHMNSDSSDEKYTALIQDLRAKQRILAKKIEVCVYKYGFLYNGDVAEQDVKQDAIDVPPFPPVLPANEPGSEKHKKVIKHKTKTIINHYHISGDLNVKNMINE